MIKKTTSGVGFIEVMTATVIISIACIGLLMGIVHARSELHALEIKERATEELLNYMEYWKGRIADGNLSPSERAGDPDGDEIYLVDTVKIDKPNNDCSFLFSNSVLKIFHSCILIY